MSRAGGKTTVKSCRFIAVLHWSRLRCFRAHRHVLLKHVTPIDVEPERHFVTLKERSRSYDSDDCSDVEQRVQIDWSPTAPSVKRRCEA
jgi:hypothetical protein